MDGTALVRPLESIIDLNIDLGAIESTVAWVLLPWSAKFVEGFLEGGFGLVPQGIVAESFFRAGGKFKLEVEPEDAVDMVKEVEAAHDFVHKLLGHAEVVSIVLAEPSDTGETREGSGNLVSMEDTKVSEPNRHVSVGADLIVEHQAMSGAVHRLHSEALLLHLEHEEVLLVVSVMAGSLPELQVEDIGRDGLLVTSDAVLSSNQFRELVVDLGSLRVEESATRG